MIQEGKKENGERESIPSVCLMTCLVCLPVCSLSSEIGDHDSLVQFKMLARET